MQNSAAQGYSVQVNVHIGQIQGNQKRYGKIDRASSDFFFWKVLEIYQTSYYAPLLLYYQFHTCAYSTFRMICQMHICVICFRLSECAYFNLNKYYQPIHWLFSYAPLRIPTERNSIIKTNKNYRLLFQNYDANFDFSIF